MESRYGTGLVLVMPFTKHDFGQLQKNLETWQRHLPCSPERGYSQFIEVTFYFHRELWNTEGIVSAIKKGQTRCFHSNLQGQSHCSSPQ